MHRYFSLPEAVATFRFRPQTSIIVSVSIFFGRFNCGSVVCTIQDYAIDEIAV
jgi:hypothetical protein